MVSLKQDTPTDDGDISLTDTDDSSGHSPTSTSTSATSRPLAKVRRSSHRPPLRTHIQDFSSTCKVIVGDTDSEAHPAQTYLVHRDLLTSASPFFAAALNPGFIEGEQATVRLPEEKPDLFEWFLHWLYTGSLKTFPLDCTCTVTPNANNPAMSSAAPHTAPAFACAREHAIKQPFAALAEKDVLTDGDLRNTAGSPRYYLLLDLYILSDKLLTQDLSNEILTTMARLSETTNSVPTPSDTWLLYTKTRETAPVRRLVLDLFAYKKTDRLIETHHDEWHPLFLRELCVRLMRPGKEIVERHAALLPWSPQQWRECISCEGCKDLLTPMLEGAVRCGSCGRGFCRRCADMGAAWVAGTKMARSEGEGADFGGCKPWVGRGVCERYHEHK